jgi:hypothetical protein
MYVILPVILHALCLLVQLQDRNCWNCCLMHVALAAADAVRAAGNGPTSLRA